MKNRKLFIFAMALIILVALVAFTVSITNMRDKIPISIMSFGNKYNNKWKYKFNYKNGQESHSYKIKEKTILNSSWDVDEGDIEAKLYNDDMLIKEIYSKDNPNYKESIDLSEYKDSKVVLKLKFIKAKGRIEFILE